MTDTKPDSGEASDAPFQPYADEETAVTIGGLTIENGTDRIALSGSLDIAADEVGLDQAKALQRAANAIVAALEAKGDLSTKAEAEEAKPAKRVRNPFA